MHGHRLIIVVLITLTLFLTSLMVILNLHPSWSQYARSLHEPILLAALSAISSTFLIRSFTHPHKNGKLFGLGKITVRMEHINRYTGFFFIGVLCTPVTHPAWYIESAHLLFTGLAILTAYSQLVFFYESGLGRILAVVGTVVGIGGFLIGFLTKWYSTGMGELIAAVPIVVFVLSTNKE